jgi:hypothetical protein
MFIISTIPIYISTPPSLSNDLLYITNLNFNNMITSRIFMIVLMISIVIGIFMIYKYYNDRFKY